MRKQYYLILLILISTTLFAQTKQETDSVLKVLKTAKEDTNKVITLTTFGYKLLWNNPTKAITYYLPAIILSQKLHYKEGEIHAKEGLGESLALNGNYTKALELKFNVLELSEKLGSNIFLGKAYVGIASAYYKQGDYEQAIRYIRTALAVPGYYTSGETPLLLNGFLGETFYKLNKLDSSLHYAQRCYEIDITNKTHWCVPYFTLASIHSNQKHYELALEFYRLGISNSRFNKEKIDGHIGLADVFYKIHKDDSTMIYAQKAIKEGKKFSFQSEVLDAAVIAKNLYKRQGNKDSVYFYKDVITEAKDSLFSQEKMRAVQNLTFNERLRQQELETLKLNNQENRKNNLQYLLIAIGLITFLSMFFALSHSIIVSTKFIEFFGVLGLLSVYEFINLFIHPYLERITNDSPLFMLIVFIAIGSMLIPLHRKAESWATKIMVEKNKQIRLANAKKTISILENEKTN